MDFAEPISFTGELQPERKEVIQLRFLILTVTIAPQGGRGGGGGTKSIFAGYVPLASQNPNHILVYSVANYRPHLSHFWG